MKRLPKNTIKPSFAKRVQTSSYSDNTKNIARRRRASFHSGEKKSEKNYKTPEVFFSGAIKGFFVVKKKSPKFFLL